MDHHAHNARMRLRFLFRLAVFAVAAIPAAAPLRANGIASVVVARDGSVYFSDHLRNRVWKVQRDGRLVAWVSGKHSHHLIIDENGTLYGEHVPQGRGEPSLWEKTTDGPATEIFRSSHMGQALSYPGSVFTMNPSGDLEFVRECQLVRISRTGSPVPWAGRRCPGEVFRDATLRYGHLHGSLAWAPAGVLLFSDARTVRRVLPDGQVTTLAGKPVTLFAPPQPGELAFDRIMGLVVDPAGNPVIAERGSRSIRRIEPSGRTTTIAKLSLFSTPIGLGSSGADLYVMTALRMATPGFLAGLVGNPTLRKISPDGRSRVIASPTRAR